MDLFQEYKELYYQEINFCDRLNSKISNAIAIITIIGTGEVLIWKDCLSKEYNALLIGLCIVSLICFLFTIYKFYRAYSNYTYAYYPIQETEKFVDYTIKLGKAKGKKKEVIDKHIENKIMQNYIKAASINRNENIRKSQAHRILNKWMIISMITVFICFSLDIIINKGN